MLLYLQILIEGAFPTVDLRYKWRMPVYYLEDKPFCYLNASHKKGFVDVAFWVSAHLTKYAEFLVTEKRKVVKSLRYFSVNEINEKILLTVLGEAQQIKNKGFYKRG